MPLRKPAIALGSKLSFGALLGVLIFKGDACICGHSHRPPPPLQETVAPSTSAATPPPPLPPPPG